MGNGIIYTIGYTTFPLEEFIAQIKRAGITCLIDVRSLPKSAHFSDFNAEVLEPILKRQGILYRNYAEEFGARQPDKSFYSNGYLDFEEFRNSERFLRGKIRIANGIRHGQRLCLMCAEKDPFDCHRCILVSRGLRDDGYKILHITGKDKYVSQEEIDSRLLNFYFPKRNQLSMFSSENLTDEEYLNEAYRRRNAEIGYKLNGGTN